MTNAWLKSSLIASAVFAAAWFRAPPTRILGIFLFYGILITILSMVIGLPLALLIERVRIGRWYSYLTVAVATGALVGGILSSHPTTCVEPFAENGEQETCVENPHAITFSPWTRSEPGFAESPPIQWSDYEGTIAFGAVIGGVLGISFWFFYSRSRPSKNPTVPSKTYAVVSPEEAAQDPYPYAFVNADGTARELHAVEREYLESLFMPFDGGRPHVKSTFEAQDGWGSVKGFLLRSKLPAGHVVAPAPANNPIPPIGKADQIALIKERADKDGFQSLEMSDGILEIKRNAKK
jgi:hypothetical protein